MRELPEEIKIKFREIAERCAGVKPGEKKGRWTHEGRVAIVYAVLCKLAILSLNKN